MPDLDPAHVEAVARLGLGSRPWEYVECRHCGQCHEPGTVCPPLEFPGAEWDR